MNATGIRQVLASRGFSLLAALGAALLSGCVTAPIPVNYAPSSVLSATGALSVADFKYLPAEKPTGKYVIAPNQIRNTAMGEIKIDRDIKVFVRDGVFAELRFVGIKVNDGTRVLTGDIEEFLVDDLGYSVDWTLRIRYVLTEAATQTVLYDGIKNTQRRTAKFANPFGALNETIKLNAEELIKDPAFMKAIGGTLEQKAEPPKPAAQ
jgi:uncharacterized lipoprotein